jgi:hypothetical protein
MREARDNIVSSGHFENKFEFLPDLAKFNYAASLPLGIVIIVILYISGKLHSINILIYSYIIGAISSFGLYIWESYYHRYSFDHDSLTLFFVAAIGGLNAALIAGTFCAIAGLPLRRGKVSG